MLSALKRKRIPLNQNECTADFRIGVPFEQNLQLAIKQKEQEIKEAREMKELSKEYKVPFVINDNIEVALSGDAD